MDKETFFNRLEELRIAVREPEKHWFENVIYFVEKYYLFESRNEGFLKAVEENDWESLSKIVDYKKKWESE